MKRLDLTLVAAAAGLVIATPAAGQMNMPGMDMPGMKTPAAKKASGKKSPTKTASKKPVAKAAKAPPARRKLAPTGKAPVTTHDMSSMLGMAMPPGQFMEGMPATTQPAHDMSSMPGMTMPPGQDMKNMPGMAASPSPVVEPSGTDLPAGNAPPPSPPSDHAADQAYGASPMAMGRHHLGEFHGGQKFSQVMLNVADYQFKRGRNGFEWVGQGWYGGDINRLWVKSEGDGEFGGGVGRAEVQTLYSHAFGPYFNFQGGLRYDFKPNPSRTYATVGVEGLAPGFFDLEAALFLSNKGEVTGRVEGSYDQRVTQRLILQPRVEINLAAQNSPAILTGSGLSDAEIGMRLRYDLRREFSPYVGVQYKRSFGATRRYVKNVGKSPGGWSILTGIRAWF